MMTIDDSSVASATSSALSWTRADWAVVLLLFLALSGIYFATASGITSSNDGSHYALTRTMVENGTFALEQFDDYAEGNDVAINPEGRLFSDRPPGTALTAGVFYVLGDWLPAPLVPVPSRHDADNPLLLYVMILPAIAGAATASLLYAIMRRFALSQAAAVTAALMFALGTAQWKYSAVLFSHALSGFLVILLLWLLFRAEAHPTARAFYFMIGLVGGYAVLVEYSNALLVVIVAVYLIITLWSPRQLRTMIIPLLLYAAGGLLPAAFLAYYNSVNFGSPFTLSYAFAINYPWAGSFTTTFSYPLLEGLRGMLYWGTGDGWCDGPCYNQGLLLLSPVLLLALPGWLPFLRQRRRQALLVAVIFITYLLLFSMHRTYHGFTADGRYLVPFLGLLALPLGYTLDWLYALRQQPLAQALLLLLAFGLFYLSVRNVFIHIGLSYNYGLDLAQLQPLPFQPENWRYLVEQIFPNRGNLPLLLLFQALMLLPLALLFRWRTRGRSR